MNLLAQLESNITETPEETETVAEETETIAEETEAEYEVEGDDPAPVQASDLDESAKYKLGDEELTGADIKAGMLRQADYTRKTQELAEVKRELHSKLAEVQGENTEFRDWLGSIKDPQTLRLELLRYYPDTYDQLREAIVSERLEEQDLSENERKIRRRLERAEAAEYARGKQDEYRAKKSEEQETVQRTARLRETFGSWLDGAMAASGLDPKDSEQQALIKADIAARFRGVKWEKAHFDQSCRRIAKLLGKELAPDPEKAKAASKLPPIRPTGHKPPAEKNKPKPKPKVETGDFFTNLRRSAGLR